MSGPVHDRGAADPDASAVTDVLLGFLLFFVAIQVVFGLLPEAAAEDARGGIERSSLGLLGGLLAVTAFGWWRRDALRWAPGWKMLWLYLPFLLVWIPLAMVFYPLCLRYLGIEFEPQEALRYYVDPGRGWRFAAVLFCTCVAAPVGEELLFRGFLYRALIRGSGAWVAVILTAALFGLIHGVLFALPVGILGLFFGYLRMRTGGVATSIAAHMLHNTWTVAVVATNPQLVTMVYDR